MRIRTHQPLPEFRPLNARFGFERASLRSAS